MKKRIGLFVINCLFFSSIFSTEFRSPWLTERGPLRYKFEQGKPDKYTIDVYAAGHRREAHKAFLSHGTNTKPLTALFFNKADVPLVEIFPDSTMNRNAVYYNPFVSLMTIYPRATYYEWGVNLGCRVEYPVWKDIGRIGARVNVPFRLIEIERENIVDKTADPTDEYILSKLVEVETGLGSLGRATVLAKAYNLGFLDSLFQDPGRNAAVDFSTNGLVRVFGTDVAENWELDNGAAINIVANKMPNAGIIYTEDNKKRPKNPSTVIGAEHHWAFNAGASVNATNAQRRDHAINWTGANIGEAWGNPALDPAIFKEIAFFMARDDAGALTDYSPLATDEQINNMWLILGYNNGVLTFGARNIQVGVDDAVSIYNESPYEWLLNKGAYELETRRLSGFGDIDLDIFYEHTFSDAWIAEIMFGVRMPTGSDDDFSGNPYKVHLGNGEHWELKVGAMLAWQPCKFCNMKLDTYFAWALESVEKRSAVFTGSKIKNMGPAVDADVNWEYFVGRFDFNFFHPKTKYISGVLGYEIYYKTADRISFRKSKMTPWYGYDFRKGQANLDNEDLEYALDNKLARANTESVGHKIRSEARLQLDQYLEVFAGGSYTFAGQNLPRETDLHCGVNVRF